MSVFHSPILRAYDELTYFPVESIVKAYYQSFREYFNKGLITDANYDVSETFEIKFIFQGASAFAFLRHKGTETLFSSVYCWDNVRP
jgi:ABC-type long-subunit fatty acid transport system fused permease/ATPase subunit